MKESRRKHSPAFKAKVALEALKEEETQYWYTNRLGVCPIFVAGWTQGKECGLQWEC